MPANDDGEQDRVEPVGAIPVKLCRELVEDRLILLGREIGVAGE